MHIMLYLLFNNYYFNSISLNCSLKIQINKGVFLTVSCDINSSRQFLNLDLKSLLNVFKYFKIFSTTYKSNSKTLCSKSSCSSNSVKVWVWILRHIKVEDDINLLNINTSPKDICGYHDSVFELFEFIISLDSILTEYIFLNNNNTFLLRVNLYELILMGNCPFLRVHLT